MIDIRVETQSSKFFFKQILRKVFLEDWVMKLVALAITLALWLGVTGLSKPITQRLTSIPLNLTYGSNVEVTNAPINQINLLISGDSRRLAQIDEKALTAYINISEVPPGDRLVPLTAETVVFNVEFPTGVKVDEILPRSMVVRIETVEVKEVPVAIETTGQVPADFEVYSSAALPARVSVRGPASFIRNLEAVATEPIDVSGKTGDFTARQIPLTVTNPKSSIVSEYSLVDVLFRIGEKRIERVYSVPLEDGRRAQIVLFGGRSVFENVKATDLVVETDSGSSGQESPRVVLPAELEGRVEVRSVKLRG